MVPGAAASFLLLSSQPVAYQDLASYLARRSGADQVWRRHVASLVRPYTVVAGFVFARPLPREEIAQVVPARLDAGGRDDLRRAGRAPGPALGAGLDRGIIYPLPNREAKGDLLFERPPLRLSIGALRHPSLLAPPADIRFASRFQRDPESTDTEHSPLALGGVQLAALAPRAIVDGPGPAADPGLADAAGLEPDPAADPGPAPAPVEAAPAPPARDEERAGIAVSGQGPIATASAGFGARSLPLENAPFRTLATTPDGEAFDPILGPFATDRRDDMPDSLVARLLRPRPEPATRAQAVAPAGAARSGVHPAVSLALTGAAHARAERCLAEAVYWEARSEPERGQMAVAQVVLNRAVSGFYPRDVCGVVYQNAHRYLSCQFTFACEGRRSLVPTEAEPWARARRIASDMMAGRTWLPEVGHATHYHATYVRPWWARRMNRLQQIGVHVFYRPRNWGSGPQVEVARAPGDS